MDAKAYLGKLLGKVLEMGGQDLFIKVGSVPRTRIGSSVKPMDFDVVKPEDTEAVVNELVNEKRRKRLESELSVDFAFNLMGSTQRFRTNVFMQQGTYSLVIRTLWKSIPSFEELRIPPVMQKIALGRSCQFLRRRRQVIVH